MVSPYLLNMPNLLLLKYNNYYNRTLKGYSNIDGYKNAVGTSGYAEVTNVNFNPRDGISTYHTVNTNFDCDYLLVIESTQPWNIISRWFVIESHYDRADQRTLILRRDVLYDYSSSYGNAPAFIEKGFISRDDPFIYNQEDMTFNQIPRGRNFLTDITNRGWIVIYLAKSRTEDFQFYFFVGNDVSNKITYTVPKDLTTVDASYDIFCLPTGNFTTYSGGTYNSTNKTSFIVAGAISKAGSGSGIVYDIQYLPYCPVIGQANITVTPNSITTAIPSNDGVAPVAATGAQVNVNNYPVLIRVNSKDLSLTKTVPYGYDLNSEIGMKVDSCTRFCRLVSPSGSSTFQFNAAKVWGPTAATEFLLNIKCTFMPYTPYIHIYPYDFGSLYGGTKTKELRGLICGGDFSLPQVSDKWQTYKVNNKNYQQIFTRQVENMEINNKFALASDITGALTGSVQGTAGGAMIGGPTGAIVGGTAGIIGGLADIAVNQAKRDEQLDYTRDMFGYNLQNIQALPQSITKLSSFVIDSLIFPMMEVYTATTEEENALKNKIKYNGMSVGRIGTFNEFKSAATSACRYVKCKIIRMDSLHEETTVANAIYSELNQGVFIS